MFQTTVSILCVVSFFFVTQFKFSVQYQHINEALLLKVLDLLLILTLPFEKFISQNENYTGLSNKSWAFRKLIFHT